MRERTTFAAAEHCGLDWRIDADTAAAHAARWDNAPEKQRRYMVREWRSQAAAGRLGNWRIGRVSADDEVVQVRFYPPRSGTTFADCRHVEFAGLDWGIFGSEAEARLAVAHHEFGAARDACAHDVLLAHGFTEIEGFGSGMRHYTRPVGEAGTLGVTLGDAETNERGWRHGRRVNVDWNPFGEPRRYIVAHIEDLLAQEEDGDTPVRPLTAGDDPFVTNVAAAVAVAEARLAVNGCGVGMNTALVTGQEIEFITPLVDAHVREHGTADGGAPEPRR